MVQSQFSLTWDAYKANICSGLCSLQQNGEFVDMTLAADGYFVKVHQVLMALVSPYLKELITSAPCQHPVIFLNNVTYKTLSSLLEYVYTGEVIVPPEILQQFLETARSLQIKGFEDVNSGDLIIKMEENKSKMESSNLCHVTGVRSVSLPLESETGQVKLPSKARKIFLKRNKSPIASAKIQKDIESPTMESATDNHDYSGMLDCSAQDSDDDCGPDDPSPLDDKSNADSKAMSNLQYSVSIRGSLQVILNRYIYNLHSSTHRSGHRRWRCVEYRNHKCTAFLITKGNIVVNRANLHNHTFHDKKIIQKIEKKAVFAALDEVKSYKEREFKDDDSAMEQDE